MSNTELEIWKDIENYPDYQVSNYGNVKSLKFGKERILKLGKNKDGYYVVYLCKNSKDKKHRVHRLIAQAFLTNPNNLPCVNHKDENKENNCISNLEFCTQEYNANYGTRNERISKTNSKPILQLSKSGNIILRKWGSAVQASNQLNIDCGSIGKCCKGKLKVVGGYRWMYYKDYFNQMNNYFDMALKEVS